MKNNLTKNGVNREQSIFLFVFNDMVRQLIQPPSPVLQYNTKCNLKHIEAFIIEKRLNNLFNPIKKFPINVTGWSWWPLHPVYNSIFRQSYHLTTNQNIYYNPLTSVDWRNIKWQINQLWRLTLNSNCQYNWSAAS